MPLTALPSVDPASRAQRAPIQGRTLRCLEAGLNEVDRRVREVLGRPYYGKLGVTFSLENGQVPYYRLTEEKTER